MLTSNRLLRVALCVQLLLAAWWRWDVTTAVIQTPYDYGTGHSVVVSENWRRHGALAQHFLPVLSIEPSLTEWPYRGEFSQKYPSVPPLAFILHYGATRLFSTVEPVLLGKLLAQTLTAASILAAAGFLCAAFGFWPALISLSFLIWSVPFLLWLANGYFAINVGQATQLVMVCWCAALVTRATRADAGHRGGIAVDAGLGATLAFLGGFADYMPFFANAIAIAGLVGLAVSGCCTRRGRKSVLAAAGGIVLGSTVAGLGTIVLYARQMGLAGYWAAITLRVAQRSGEAPFARHIAVIRQQMLTGWPPGELIALFAVLAFVLGWCVLALARREAGRRADGLCLLIVLAVGIGPSLIFHYRAVNYVAIHWWFAGTWAIGWAMVLCVFIWLVEPLVARVRPVHAAFCVILFGLTVGLNARFVSVQETSDQRSLAVLLYRTLGHDLPVDGIPLVVTDLTTGRPGLFEDFPFATAYLRRPVVLRDPSALNLLPHVDEQGVRIGGEDASQALLRYGGNVYVAYDPDARSCFAPDVALSAWSRSVPVKICLTSAATFVLHPETVLGPITEHDQCSVPPLPPTDLHVASNSPQLVTMAWRASFTKRTDYTIEAGSRPGLADVMTDQHGREEFYKARDVKPGTYYVRVRGRNPCGISDPSNEVLVTVR